METEYRAYMRTDLIERLNSLYRKLNRDNYDNLVFEVTHNTFLNIIYDVKRYFYEILLNNELSSIRGFYGSIDFCINSYYYRVTMKAIEDAFSAKTFEDIFKSCSLLSDMLSGFENNYQYIGNENTLRYFASDLKSSLAQYLLKKYIRQIPRDLLSSLISAKDDKTKFKFLNCTTAEENPGSSFCDKVDYFDIAKADWQPSFEFYGTIYRAKLYNAEPYKKIIKGEVEACNITPKSFDVVHSCCSLTSYVDSDDSVYVDSNKNYMDFAEIFHIRRLCSLLKDNGIIILHLPFYALSNDFCKDFAKRFTEISVVKDFENKLSFSLVTLVARKRSNNEIDKKDYGECYHQLRNVVFSAEINYDNKSIFIETNTKNYTLSPSSDKKKKFVFIGTSVDDNQLRQYILDNPLYQKTYNKKEEVYDKYANKNPLLPFTNGQLGLVLVSGFCDGVIEEEDGSCHIVKGRSSKHIETSLMLSDDIVTERKNYSNKVEINIFEPDGTYKNLI